MSLPVPAAITAANTLASLMLVAGWLDAPRSSKRVSEREEESFLKRNYRDLPRTTLRYAIERFAEPKRLRYLRGTLKL